MKTLATCYSLKNLVLKGVRIALLVYIFISSGIKVFSQVNLQTGSATFNLPIFNWQDDKSRLNTVVALEYSSGTGLKVNDVASNIGQGWNLIAGGVITRMQVGEPDDQLQRDGNGTIEDVTKYPAGFLYNQYAGTHKGCPKALTYYPIFKDENHVYKQNNPVAADRELDYFSFQFNGRTGIFVLDKTSFNTSAGTGGVLLIGDSKLKVTFKTTNGLTRNGLGIRTTISSFTIQDENGVIYKFEKLGLTKVLRTEYCDADLTAKQTQPDFDGGNLYNERDFDVVTVNPYVINQWYLTEIDDALVTNRSITFSYFDENINTPAGTQITYNANKDYSLVSSKTNIGIAPALSTINMPDGHIVIFNYGLPRVDLNGAGALSSIDLVYKTRHLSQYQLTTSYFILNRYGTPVTDYERSVARLCLVAIKKIGVDLKSDEQPYRFDYYFGTTSNADDVVPPPFYYKKDIWGFYNGDNTTDYYGHLIDPTLNIRILKNDQAKGACFLRNSPAWAPLNNPKENYAQNGLLKQIVYPTGGSLKYSYAQNKTGIDPTAISVGGVHVSQISASDGGFSNDCSNPLITTYNYVTNNGGSSLWGIEQPVTIVKTEAPYAPEFQVYKWSFPFGHCTYKYSYPGILFRESKVDISGMQKFLKIFSEIMNIIGILQDIKDVANLCAGANGALLSVIIDVIAGIIDVVLSCAIDESRDNPAEIWYNTDLNASNPLPSQFSRVEVVNQNISVTGKTVYDFTVPTIKNPVWEPSNPTYSMKQRFAPWAYGLPQRTTVYDANNYIIEQTENYYDDTTYGKERYCTNAQSLLVNPNQNCEIDESCKCYVTITSSKRNTVWSESSFYDDPMNYTTANIYKDGTQNVMQVEFYNIYTGRVLLTDTKHRIFKKNDNNHFIETAQHFDYNPDNYLVNKTTTTQTNGDKNIQEITYTSDYKYYSNGYQELSTLYQNNMLNIPITATNSVIKSGGTDPLYLSETITEFKTNSNGDIKPYRKLEERVAQPTPASSWVTYAINDNGSNASSFIQTQTLSYDNNDNLVGLKDEGNHSVANIYGYDDKYIIASVINDDASVDKQAYTSFETKDNTQDFGTSGWSLSGSANFITNNTSPTGTIVFGLSASNSISANNLNTVKAYRLSFWSSAAVTVTGNATLSKSNPTINGFKYYEYNIAANTSTVTISGTANIDELRLYPSTARMRTVTYDPLIGKTSECDENNRITYYDYDDLGRLQLIKDENRNIVKMYEYNVVSNKTAGCPVNYGNHAFSEIFTKQGCASGYTGASITYTVAAGQFTSTISQYDADLKAEAYLLANGQTAANNAACILIYSNAAKSVNFITHNCGDGEIGGTVTYTVPAGRYTSIISQADADQMANVDVKANGQAFANDNANKVCTIDYNPHWEAGEPAQTQCQQVGGLNTGHVLVLMTDVNPNSNTPAANRTQWLDGGPYTSSCPVSLAFSGSAPALNGTAYSTQSGSGYITGTIGATVHVTVRLHSSNTSAYLGIQITGIPDDNLSGSGDKVKTFDIVIPDAGYIQWSLSLQGTPGSSGYISSNLSLSY